MDVEYNTSTEAQMDLETMIEQMEKFPDFPYEALPSPSIMDFPLDVPIPLFMDTPPATSPAPAPITPPSATSFNSRTAVQNPAAVTPVGSDPTATVLRRLGEPPCGGGDPLCDRPPSPRVAMRELMFCMAAMQPVHIDPASVKPPKRRNVRISKDPQTVAARHRRERISERMRTLQRLVPGGMKMDTASMLDEAIHYVKFLKTHLQSLELAAAADRSTAAGLGLGLPPPPAVSGGDYSCFLRGVYGRRGGSS